MIKPTSRYLIYQHNKDSVLSSFLSVSGKGLRLWRQSCRLPSASGRRLGVGGGWEAGSCRPVYILASRYLLLCLLGLGLGYPSQVVLSKVMEAGAQWRNVRRRVWWRWSCALLSWWCWLHLSPSFTVWHQRRWKTLPLLLRLQRVVAWRWRIGVLSGISSDISDGSLDCEVVGTRIYLHLFCKNGENRVHPWGCIFCRLCWFYQQRWYQQRWIVGLVAIGFAGDCSFPFPFISSWDGGRWSFKAYDACWRRLQELALVADPKFGVVSRGGR
jgi:hypothetical protein